MRATSKASFEAAAELWEPVLATAGERARVYGEQLYALSDLLSGSSPLRRSLSDPSRTGDDKAALVDQLFRGKVEGPVLDLVEGLVRARWSSPENLAHALEVFAVDSVLAAAQAQGRLETVEDELFRIDRLLASERGLRLALSDSDAPIAQRVALVKALFGGRVSPETEMLVERSTATVQARSMTSALNAIVERAAERRKRLVATVTAAAPLTQAQVQRLEAILERAYGRAIQVNVGVDERVIGGVRVRVGSEVVDATTLARLDEARRRLAG